MAIRATGAAELRLIALACKREATGRLILNDMKKEIRRGAIKRVRTEVRAEAVAKYPKRGGLNIWVAKAPVRVAVLTGANSAGVKVRVGRKGHDFKSLDAQGIARHPLFGNRGHWYGNAVAPGVISEAISEEGRDVVERAVLTAAERAVARIVGA